MKIAFIISFISLITFAQTFGDLQHRGSGCPEGSVSITPSPDHKVLSIIFDSYSAQVPQYDQNNDNQDLRGVNRVQRRRNDPTLAYKACALSLVAELPIGQKIDSVDLILNIRGISMLDLGTEASFSAALVGYQGLMVGQRRGFVLERKLFRAHREAVDQDWMSQPTVNIPIGSNCAVANSKAIRFDLKTHLQSEILVSDLTRNALITLDSIDAEGMIKLKLNTSPCNFNTPSGANLPLRRRP